ncbi:MAG: hypothetical protein ACAH07_00580 [Methylophilaceae bacterium]|nr:hypothetical protein [Methyloradius sp.]
MALFTKIVLCASGNQLTAGVWSWRKLRSFQVFDNDAQGKEDFAHFLQQFPNTNIYLLADSVEEDYRVENLPHTFGGAKHELVERKLSQIYRNSVFRVAHFINREKDKRKDDRYLFLALNKVEFLAGWLEVIEAQQAPLTGVYMLSMLSQVILRRMRLVEPHIILSERLNSGLRQTYLHNGNLRISRLAPMPPEAENQLAYFYLVETEKTRLYLISQRFITRETPLKMLLPGLDDSSKVICRHIEQEQGIDCERIDLSELAHSIHIKPQLLDANPELLHMHLLAIGNVPDNLAPATLVKQHQVQLIRQGINLASIFIVLLGLLMSGLYVNQALDLTADTKQAALDTQLQNQRYADVAKNFPSTPIASNDLATAVEINDAIKQYGKAPRRMMQVISNALEASPEIQLDRLHWMQTNDVSLKDDDKTLLAVPSEKTSQQSSFVPDPTVLYEVGFINGQIKMFNGDYRAALDSVNHLAELLKADSNVENVEILQAPVNVSSYTALQGSTNDEKAALQAAAMFKLRVILKREVPTT